MIGSTEDPKNKSGEPGLNLANLVVAERNARTAVALAEEAIAKVAVLETRVAALEQQLTQKEQMIMSLQQQAASSMLVGTGPTAG